MPVNKELKMKNRTLTILVALSISLLSLSASLVIMAAGPEVEDQAISKLSSDLLEKTRSNVEGSSSVIVLTGDDLSLDLNEKLAKMGGKIDKKFKMIKGFSAELPN